IDSLSHANGAQQKLHTFPTRRSSDLGKERKGKERKGKERKGKKRKEKERKGKEEKKGNSTRHMDDMSTFSRRRLKSYRSHKSWRSEEHTSELQSRENLVCRLLLEKKK